MEKTVKKAKKVRSDTEQFLKHNPEIAKALDLFELSYEQYRVATEAAVPCSTEASTNSTYNGYGDHIRR